MSAPARDHFAAADVPFRLRGKKTGQSDRGGVRFAQLRSEKNVERMQDDPADAPTLARMFCEGFPKAHSGHPGLDRFIESSPLFIV
jgi:hypothetical protein